ncbi:MAG: Lrp/AsnC family transcriptional regulator [Thermoplasmataceae archaeon]|jgi:Lrp/AsnC family leucine-responsive transcriptional regulator
MKNTYDLDETDKDILRVMLNKKTNSLTEIGTFVNLTKSAVEKRVKRMKQGNLINGFIPQLNREKLPEYITAFSLIRAKYGPKYSETVGKELSKIQGVCGVYFILGDNDFIVILKAKDIEELNGIVNNFSSIENIERSNTFISMSTQFEDISRFILI